MTTEASITADLDDRPDPEDKAISQPRGRHRLSMAEPRPWAARPRLLAIIAVAVVVVAAGLALLIPTASESSQGDLSAGGQPGVGEAGSGAEPGLKNVIPTGEPGTLAAAPVAVDFDGFFSWALLDGTGEVSGSPNQAEPAWVGSVVKVWIVSDYLRRSAERGDQPAPSRLEQARRAIRDSDDGAADALYRASGGTAQLYRMISICNLTDASVEGSRWRGIRMSARDTARLGRCVTDGRAAGPSWTDWVRTEMTRVRGSVAESDQPYGGRWGIIDGLPANPAAGDVGIKNGWITVDGEWQVNCLAAADRWSLSVLLRYPAGRGLRYGAETCAKVAAQLVAPHSGQA